MIESTTFEFGEAKYVSIEVKSFKNTPFSITTATCELESGGEKESTGEVQIEQVSDDRTILQVLVNPMKKNALYTLKFMYEIPPEKLIHEVQIKTV